MMKSVYLAGPIAGLTYKEGSSWRDDAASFLRERGVDAYSPLRGKENLESEGILDSSGRYGAINVLASSKGIVTRDYNDCTRCDMVLAYLKGAQRVSIGTVMEIAWAYAHRVPCVVVMEDGNVHEHAMIEECAGYRVESLDEGLHIVLSVLLPSRHQVATQ